MISVVVVAKITLLGSRQIFFKNSIFAVFSSIFEKVLTRHVLADFRPGWRSKFREAIRSRGKQQSMLF